MKKILALLVLAGSLRADIVGPVVMQLPDQPSVWPIAGTTPTYALNNALTGTSSSTIDLSGSTGIYLTVTMTGSGIADVIFTNSDTATAPKVYSIQIPGSYNIPMKARYLTIRNNPGNLPTARVSAYYYKATPSISASISGGGIAVGVTSTPSYSPIGMLNYNATSYSAQTLNLTATASASVPCVVCLSSNGGPAAGFKVQFTTSATAPVVLTSTSQGHYIAASTTAQCWGPFQPGVHLHAAGVAATSSILVDIQKVQ